MVSKTMSNSSDTAPEAGLREVRKLRKPIITFVMSVSPPAHPQATTRPPLDELSLNLIFEDV